jgi:hypothetical protein
VEHAVTPVGEEVLLQIRDKFGLAAHTGVPYAGDDHPFAVEDP